MNNSVFSKLKLNNRKERDKRFKKQSSKIQRGKICIR